MGCFVVPLTQAIATTVYRRKQRKAANTTAPQLPWVQQLHKLELMLWGGSAMLIVDHIINGEVTWRYPFFTALEQEGGALTLLREMLTVGLPMSVVITLIYSVMCWRSRKTLVRYAEGE